MNFLKQQSHIQLTHLCVAFVGIASFIVAHLWQWMGASPCVFCKLERWLFLAAGLSGLTGFLIFSPLKRLLLILNGLIWTSLTGIIFWHFGMQKHWFKMPGTCKAVIPEGTPEEIEYILSMRPQVTCDTVPFSIMGLPHTFYMMILTLTLLGLCFWALIRKEKR